MIASLDEAKREQRRCMGGVDPVGCVAAAKRIVELRNQLRDDAALLQHFQNVLNEPRRTPRRRRKY